MATRIADVGAPVGPAQAERVHPTDAAPEDLPLDAQDPSPEALRAGDGNALARLYDTRRERVYNLALRILRDPEEALDATQEVFLKACRDLPRQPHDVRIDGWLYRVTTYTCFDILRRRRARPADPSQDLDERSGDGDPFERYHTAALIDQTLARMGVRQRAALLLRDVHGLHHGEIGAALDISEGAAQVLVFRARDTFRARFGELAEPADAAGAGCGYSREMASLLVGARISRARRRELLAPAEQCGECRRTLDRSKTAVGGLGAFLAPLTAPAALEAWPLPVAEAAAAAEAAVGAGATAAGGHAAAHAAGAGLQGGVLAKLGGLAGVKLGSLAGVKAAAVAAAIALATAGGGYAVYGAIGAEDGVPAHGAAVAAPLPGQDGRGGGAGAEPDRYRHGRVGDASGSEAPVRYRGGSSGDSWNRGAGSSSGSGSGGTQAQRGGSSTGGGAAYAGSEGGLRAGGGSTVGAAGATRTGGSSGGGSSAADQGARAKGAGAVVQGDGSPAETPERDGGPGQ
jgi:RNA polymerase sigma-70 factor (ECF subfamily)